MLCSLGTVDVTVHVFTCARVTRVISGSAGLLLISQRKENEQQCFGAAVLLSKAADLQLSIKCAQACASEQRYEVLIMTRC